MKQRSTPLPQGREGARKRIVVTGGPGGGKSTAAEVFRRELGERVIVVRESAESMGFPLTPPG